ncbi:MAG: hypothetical protein H6R40_1453 [Gemmatimonadetes bacterium]|nr:hypothetical protein [Gemmatimonadota bacterium]
MRWGVKRKSNDELRQRFINLTVPQAQAVGLIMPDPDLHQDEASGDWIPGPINWDEFHQVLAGNGPCNRQRIEARREAHANGAWVRAAAAAYAAKRHGRGGSAAA